MKKEFTQLVKEMRVAFHPEFKAISNNSELNKDQFDKALTSLEEKQKNMIVENGYSQVEFDAMCREHFMDFSASNPDEWVIRHDPDNAQVII